MNEEEIASVLREADYDVQIHNFAEKSFCEQVRIMQTSKVVISNHGAQLVNLLFLQPGSAVIELFNPFFILDMYREMAKRAEIRRNLRPFLVFLPSGSREWFVRNKDTIFHRSGNRTPQKTGRDRQAVIPQQPDIRRGTANASCTGNSGKGHSVDGDSSHENR